MKWSMATFSILIFWVSIAEAQQDIREYPYFNPATVSYIDHSFDQSLWLLDQNIIKRLVLSEDKWEPTATLLVSHDGQELNRVVSTPDTIWITAGAKLYAVPTSSIDLSSNITSEIDLTLFSWQEIVQDSLVSSMQRIPNTSRVLISQTDEQRTENEFISIYNIQENQIELISEIDTFCPSTNLIMIGSANIVIRCTNGYSSTLYDFTENAIGNEVSLGNSGNSDPLYIDISNNVLLLSDSDGNLYELNLSSGETVFKMTVSARPTYVSPLGHFALTSFDYQNIETILTFYERDSQGDYTIKKLLNSDLVPSAFTSSYDKILMSSDRYVFTSIHRYELDDETSNYIYATSDWRRELGIYHAHTPLTSKQSSSLIFAEEDGFQIYELNSDSEFVKVTTGSLKDQDGRSLKAYAKASNGDDWWVTGRSTFATEKTISVMNIKRDGKTIERQLPGLSGDEDLESTDTFLWYWQNTDTLGLWIGSTNRYYLCDNAKDFENSQCQLNKIDEPVTEIWITKDGLLTLTSDISQSPTYAEFSYFTLQGLQLENQWTISKTSFTNVTYVPDTDFVFVTIGEEPSTSDLIPSKIALNGLDAGVDVPLVQGISTNYEDCYWSNTKNALCVVNDFVTEVLLPTEDAYNLQLFNPLISDNLNILLLVANEAELLTLDSEQSKLKVVSVPLSGLSLLSDQPTYSFTQDIEEQISLSQLLDGNSQVAIERADLALFREGQARVDVAESLLLNDGVNLSVTLPNDYTIGDPTGLLQLTLIAGDWTGYFRTVTQVINVNDAPVLVEGGSINENLDLGDTYQLALSTLFYDIDIETLNYTLETESPGITLEGQVITLVASNVGPYEMFVTATDPGGLSASVRVFGNIVDNSSGGGMLSWMLSLLVVIVIYRQRYLCGFKEPSRAN